MFYACVTQKEKCKDGCLSVDHAVGHICPCSGAADGQNPAEKPKPPTAGSD